MAVLKANAGQNYYSIVLTVKPMRKRRTNSDLASFTLQVSFNSSCHPVSCSDPKLHPKGVEQRMLWTLFQTGGAHKHDMFTEEYGYRVVAAGRKGRYAFFTKRVPASSQLFSEIMCNSKKIHLRVWVQGLFSYGKGWGLMNIPMEDTTVNSDFKWDKYFFYNHIGGLHTRCCKGQKYLRVKWN